MDLAGRRSSWCCKPATRAPTPRVSPAARGCCNVTSGHRILRDMLVVLQTGSRLCDPAHLIGGRGCCNVTRGSVTGDLALDSGDVVQLRPAYLAGGRSCYATHAVMPAAGGAAMELGWCCDPQIWPTRKLQCNVCGALTC
ncbi:hypothetical protein VPH35_046288 [Triticum aestivum]